MQNLFCFPRKLFNFIFFKYYFFTHAKLRVLPESISSYYFNVCIFLHFCAKFS